MVNFLFCSFTSDSSMSKHRGVIRKNGLGDGMWEKESNIDVQLGQENPNPRVHHSCGKLGNHRCTIPVGNSESLVSHWNGGPSGWDFPVPTEHQWWILFFLHTGQNFSRFSLVQTNFIVYPYYNRSVGCHYFPHRKEGGHIVFGADPVGVDVSVTLSCLHDISWTGGWILTKFAWI